jgi:hypothetical protein
VDPLKTTKYGPYDFTGCNKNGQLGGSCHEFIRKSRCVKQCDPNGYAHYPDGQDNLAGAQQIPVCDNFCSDFFAACKNERICYSNDKMKDVLIGWISGDITGDTDVTVFSCGGEEGTDYDCEPLGNTILAGNGGLFDNGSDKDKPVRDLLKKKLEEFEELNGKRAQPYQTFCERFSTRLYAPVDNQNDICVDPRQPSSMADYARSQSAYTKYATEPCATGLSAGAIAGIVIGCLAGVALIAGLVYFFACKSSDESETYTAGSASAGGSKSYTSSDTQAQPGNIVKQGSDYDPAERTASADP